MDLRKAIFDCPSDWDKHWDKRGRYFRLLFLWDLYTPLAADPPFLKTELLNRTRTIRVFFSSEKIEARHFPLTVIITQVTVTGDDP